MGCPKTAEMAAAQAVTPLLTTDGGGGSAKDNFAKNGGVVANSSGNVLAIVIALDKTLIAKLDPDNDGLFSWWPPWRNMRQRNMGWRIDYILASANLADKAIGGKILAEVGTSDHAPVTATFSL